MDTDDPPRCQRCAGATKYVARISLPARVIYRCEACGKPARFLASASAQHAQCPKRERGKVFPKYVKVEEAK